MSGLASILEWYGRRLQDAARNSGRKLFDSQKPRVLGIYLEKPFSNDASSFISLATGNEAGMPFQLKSGKCVVVFGKTTYLKAMRLNWCYPAFFEWLKEHPSETNRRQIFEFFDFIPAVGAIPSNSDGDILLGNRSAKVFGTNAGTYSLPVGLKEVNETFDKAILRELKEETGLKARLAKTGFVVPNPDAPSFNFVKPAIIEKELEIKRNEEFDNLLFVPARLLREAVGGKDSGLTRFLEDRKLPKLPLSKTTFLTLTAYFRN